MFVKICGTTNLADAALAVTHGADALGFILAPSKRRVSVQQVAAITRQLPAHVLRVGVFTVPDVREIARAVRDAGLTGVQMHWPYQAGLVTALRNELRRDVELWQVVGFAADASTLAMGAKAATDIQAATDAQTADRQSSVQLRAAMLDSQLNVVLLDAVKHGASGGLGQAFSWQRAAPFVEAARQAAEEHAKSHAAPYPRLAVAGGLQADNVRDAVSTLRPWGVDVVSGVEASPGRKDPRQLEAFLKAARAAGADFSSLQR